MSATTPCTPCCSSTVQTVNTPGGTGASAITTTSANFTIPAIGSTVLISCGDTSWLKAFKNVFISDGANLANFIITAVNSATSFTGKFLGFVADSAAGTAIQSGAIVIPGIGDFTVPWDLDALTAFTDSSGGTKSDTIAATCVKFTQIIGPFSMALLVNSQIWKVPIQSAFTINSATFRCDIAITTGAKAATLTTQISGVACTGGVMAVAGTYATAATQAGTAISGANTGTAGQLAEIAVSGVTAFTEGVGHVELSITNTDLAATLAAMAFKANQLRTALRHQ